LIDDPDHRWRRPWIAACALVAVLPRHGDPADFALRPATSLDEPDADEWAVVQETLDGLRRRLNV
jgi:hypothetical protein